MRSRSDFFLTRLCRHNDYVAALAGNVRQDVLSALLFCYSQVPLVFIDKISLVTAFCQTFLQAPLPWSSNHHD